MNGMEKQYLGDAVYVRYDGYGTTLTTENGMFATNSIYLEPEVRDKLITFLEKLKSASK